MPFGLEINTSTVGEIIGICGSLWGGGSLWFARLTTTWPSVKGRIVASLVDVGTDGDGYRYEKAEIAYQYTIDGREFAGSQINGGVEVSWSTSIPRVSSSRETVQELPLDAEVDVFYWPRFPGIACLRPGKYSGGVVLIVFSLTIFAICLCGNHT